MKKFVCGIRHKESKVIYGPQVVDDVKHWTNEIKAFLSANATSSFAMFPADYELVYKEFDTNDDSFVGVCLPNSVVGDDHHRV